MRMHFISSNFCSCIVINSCLQLRTGEAEANLERLHQCAEKELQNYLSDGTSEDFNSFRTKLAGLTRYTLSLKFLCNQFHFWNESIVCQSMKYFSAE